MTPLLTAAAAGHAEIVRALLESGADPNLATANGRGPLHLAVDHGHVSVVETL